MYISFFANIFYLNHWLLKNHHFLWAVFCCTFFWSPSVRWIHILLARQLPVLKQINSTSPTQVPFKKTLFTVSEYTNLPFCLTLETAWTDEVSAIQDTGPPKFDAVVLVTVNHFFCFFCWGHCYLRVHFSVIVYEVATSFVYKISCFFSQMHIKYTNYLIFIKKTALILFY